MLYNIVMDKLKELEAERDRLMKEIVEHEKPAIFENNPGDEHADTSETEQLANDLGIAQALKERLEEVENQINHLKEEQR